MENELLSANITISAIEANQYGLKIKDERGLVYNIPQFKKDNTVAQAYQTIISMPGQGLGTQKCFKFVLAANKQGGESRYVRIISEPEITKPAPQPQYNNPVQPNCGGQPVQPYVSNELSIPENRDKKGDEIIRMAIAKSFIEKDCKVLSYEVEQLMNRYFAWVKGEQINNNPADLDKMPYGEIPF
jgi:hypothetical protein